MVGTKSTQSTRCFSISSRAWRRVEAGHQHDGPAAQELLPGGDEGAGVIQRAGHQRGAARLHAVLGQLGIALRGREVEDQLGPPGAPAGGHGADLLRGDIGKCRVRAARDRARSRPAGSAAPRTRRRARPPPAPAAPARRSRGARARGASTRSAAGSRRASRSARQASMNSLPFGSASVTRSPARTPSLVVGAREPVRAALELRAARPGGPRATTATPSGSRSASQAIARP